MRATRRTTTATSITCEQRGSSPQAGVTSYSVTGSNHSIGLFTFQSQIQLRRPGDGIILQVSSASAQPSPNAVVVDRPSRAIKSPLDHGSPITTDMHPHHIFLHRGPSRIFWFFIGAGVATWWHHSSIMRDHRAQYYPCVMRRRVQDAPSDTPSQDAAQPNSSWGPDRTPTGWYQQRDWEQDRERLKQLQKRAGETVRRPLSA